MLLVLCLAVVSISDVYGWSRKKKSEPVISYASYGDTVKINYTGKLTDGTVFDSTLDKQPFEFKLGDGTVLPSVEEVIIGMTEGESKTTTISSDKAYGPHRDELVKVVERTQFPADFTPQVGLYLKVKQTNDKVAVVKIVDIKEDKVTLDANHPLSGKDLIFDIQLVDIV
ncbi:peptidylprolyl isomerase [bacterium]|nr:peptidylprolyl isomerase [bacterium]